MSEERAEYGGRLSVLMCKQGSPEWLQARLGVPTASMICKVITPLGKPRESKGRRSYAIQLAMERITKRPICDYKSASMERGSDLEGVARMWYFCETGRVANQVGFCMRTDIYTGASPDGLVGVDGCVEIKCFELSHVGEVLATGEIDSEILLQCQHVMLVAGRQWCDFVLYTDVRPFAGWIKRVYADVALHRQIEAALVDFNAEVDAMVLAIIERAGITADKLDFVPPVFNEDGEEDITTGEMEASEL
jgi:hypothetical protein